jgi:hypothetical protein
MVFEPPAGRWVDKIGPGIPITVALLMQAVAWSGDADDVQHPRRPRHGAGDLGDRGR